MNLGPRCNAILDNKCQCPNTVLPYSAYCKLHNTLLKQMNKLKDSDATGFKQE